jgi:dihydroorotate dehydrogenase (fumarate)
VIASLNGTSPESWLLYARQFEAAGAKAVELNCYHIVTETNVPGTAVEEQILHVVKELRHALRIPIAVKLSPYFSAFANFASRLDAAGANGLVLFNRFYQSDIDIRTMTPVTSLELSRSSDLPLRLQWLAILFGRVRASLALTGGVETVHDGIKGLLAGADAVQTVSAVLRHGPDFLTRLRDGLTRWMEAQHFTSIEEMRGKVSLAGSPDPSAFERANYIRTLQLWNK